MEDRDGAMGYGKFSARQVLAKLAPGSFKDDTPEVKPDGLAVPVDTLAPLLPSGVRDDKADIIKVKGMDDLLVYRAKCCNPIRGEAIVGYVTRGKGVAVHSKQCPNVEKLMYDVERKI